MSVSKAVRVAQATRLLAALKSGSCTDLTVEGLCDQFFDTPHNYVFTQSPLVVELREALLQARTARCLELVRTLRKKQPAITISEAYRQRDDFLKFNCTLESFRRMTRGAFAEQKLIPFDTPAPVPETPRPASSGTRAAVAAVKAFYESSLIDLGEANPALRDDIAAIFFNAEQVFGKG